MSDDIVILNRIGLILGLVGSLFLAVGILGQERIRCIEKSTRQTLKILVNPRKFIKDVYDGEQVPWLIFIIIPLSLFLNAIPAIMIKYIGSIPIVSTLLYWFQWHWNLPDWLNLLIIFPSVFGLLIVFISHMQSKTPMKFSKFFLIMEFILIIYISPAIPIILLLHLIWFLLLVLISTVFWIITFPLQLGFTFQERFDLTGSFEPAGIVLLGLAFLLQLIATF